MALKLEEYVHICASELRGKGILGWGCCREGEVREGWRRAARCHLSRAKLIELEGPKKSRSLGARLAMTEPERDPELESNGLGKWNGITREVASLDLHLGKLPETPAQCCIRRGQVGDWRLTGRPGRLLGMNLKPKPRQE